MLLFRLSLSLLCVGAAFGQTAGSQPSLTKKKASALRAPVPLQMVEAVAERSDGTPVRDLTPADFAVTLNGQPAKIESVWYVDTAAATIAPASSEIALRPDQIHRTLVFLADDLGLPPLQASEVRNALSAFVRDGMRSTDVVSIVRTSSGSGVGEKLTSDRRELEAAIRDIQYQPPDTSEESRAGGARATLRAVLAGLGNHIGRKAVVLFSANRELIAKTLPSGLPDEANALSAVFSLIDVGPGPPAPAESGLELLARQTGGRSFARPVDLSSALAAALRDQDGYYLVRYQPPGGPYYGGRQVPVLTTTRAGVELRARNSLTRSANFVGDAARRENWRPSFTTPADDLRRALTNPFAGDGIPLRFAAAYMVGPMGGWIEGHLVIAPNDVTFTRRLDGRITASLDIQIAVFNENGQATQTDSRTYALQLTAEDLERTAKLGFTATPVLHLRGPRPQQVRVAVRDGTSGRVGAASQFLEIPDAAGGDLVVSGVSVPAKDNPEITDAPLNLFHAGETFHFLYQVLNVQADESRRSRIEMQALVLHDGEKIYTSKREPIEFSPAEDPR